MNGHGRIEISLHKVSRPLRKDNFPKFATACIILWNLSLGEVPESPSRGLTTDDHISFIFLPSVAEIRGVYRIPRRRGRNHTILQNFPKNCMKLRKFSAMGVRAGGAPLRTATSRPSRGHVPTMLLHNSFRFTCKKLRVHDFSPLED